MSRAFDSAFEIIKMNHLKATYGAVALFDSILMKAREDEILRKNLEDYMQMSMAELTALPPDEKEYAFNLIQAARAGVNPSPPPNPENLVSTEDPQGQATMPKKPMAKALDAFFDAESIRKNVIGTQEAGRRNTPVQYSMPPSVASMAQRPQVAEMEAQTTQVPQQAPGMFGRFKAPVMTDQTTLVPTGDTVAGGPATMNVQQNPENPMAGIGMGVENAHAAGLGGQMMLPPGATVERMPRPSPFNFPNQPPSRSFAGQGYTVNDAGEYVRPKNPYRNEVGTQNRLNYQDFESDLRLPVGQNRMAGDQTVNPGFAQQGATDQFTQLGY